jgi:hypothetical protein
VSLEPRNNGNVLALVALHPADLNFSGGFSLEVAALDEGGLGFFLCSVFGGSFSCRD